MDSDRELRSLHLEHTRQQIQLVQQQKATEVQRQRLFEQQQKQSAAETKLAEARLRTLMHGSSFVNGNE